MKMPKTLDNKTMGSVYKELQENIENGTKLSVIAATFTLYAYEGLKEELKKIDNMRFIYKNSGVLENNNSEVREYYINNNKRIYGNPFEIKLRNELTQSSIAKDCEEWIKEKLEIKSFKNNGSNTNMICVENDEDDKNLAMNGGLDFSANGLGLTPSDAKEGVQCIYGKKYCSDNLRIFDSIWNDDNLEDVKYEVINQIKVIYKENSPEFIYFVSMYNIFANYLDELKEDTITNADADIKETKIWNTLFKFQKDAVIGAIDKIEKYNGCIIADSVGLGKTYTALAIIKYYYDRNHRVLVLTPKKLRENWTVYADTDIRNIFEEDRFTYKVLNHTDLSRKKGYSGDTNLETVRWEGFDLLVIDESHNFRNRNPRKDKQTRYDKLMDDIIKSGRKTKVLMLSATPVNNGLKDIKNQIELITGQKNNAFEEVGINSLQGTLKTAQQRFNNWTKLDERYRTNKKFIDMMDMEYFKLLDTITIARSRKHIEKYYGLDEIGHFPLKKTPINKNPDIDIANEFSSIETISEEILKLYLGIYSPLSYILPSKVDLYEKKYDTVVGVNENVFKQADRETQLIKLMRINMLKRMESSIYAFRITLENLIGKIDDALEKISNHDETEFNPDYDIRLIDPDEDDFDDLIFGKKKKVLLQDMDLVKWSQDLNEDRKRLKLLSDDSKQINPDRDKKLQELKELIVDKINNPINENNKKIAIFTAFADTANYLYKNINNWALEELGIYSSLVTGSVTKTNLKESNSKFKNEMIIKSKNINDILTNFSPKSKNRTEIYGDFDIEIDLLIATDCISEGQNLQDCDYLINYDIHWNPVRIIQRFGRIDRIGSKNEEIQLVNFWPNMELDEYINLSDRVGSKMFLVDQSATADENIFLEDDGAKNEANYREKQLKKLQDEIVDLDDVSDGISITDFTFNDFKIDLREHLKENEDKFKNAPTGIYSIVEIEDKLKEDLESGVIFLLKQTHGEIDSKDKNALSPYYLVHINEEGEIKYNYTHAKKILDNYKKLCSGKNKVFKSLVKDFNKKTIEGKKMDKYSNLLKIAIEGIIGKKDESMVDTLFSLGETATPHSFTGINDFELITFLILK
ncbi:MAG: DEAD/DEAH box helicase family protein [Methanobrevibacter sp.]|jgi:superfamily II DNA or RNA helicase|nr:DEAD/DEAH box helicase family protein [Candidatus Methanovirga meridionalis]